MTSENQASNPYAAVLADLRRKRAEIDNTIKVLESVSGMKLADTGAGDLEWVDDKKDTNASLDAGEFLGMSIVDASKKLLALRKRQMGNPEIAKELAAGGLVMNSADPVNTVGSVLTRRFNQVGDVVRVGRGTWGLKEWYPNRTFKPSGKTAQRDEPDNSEHRDSEPSYNADIDADISDLLGGQDGQAAD